MQNKSCGLKCTLGQTPESLLILIQKVGCFCVGLLSVKLFLPMYYKYFTLNRLLYDAAC